MNTIGIDPDTKDTAIGYWNDSGPVGASVIHVVRRKTSEQSQVLMARQVAQAIRKGCEWGRVEAVAIEGQQIDKRRARPADLFTLAHTTGMAAVLMVMHYPDALIVIPTPKVWKGRVAKHAHQARLYDDLGWGYKIIGTGDNRYARPLLPPSKFEHITPGAWKHVGDALLLARWAHQQNQ